MFTHPQHVIEIHRRQVLEWTREHNHGGSILAATSPRERPTHGRTLFGWLRALRPYPATPQPGTPAPTLSTQE
jgi:hypothetical protein